MRRRGEESLRLAQRRTDGGERDDRAATSERLRVTLELNRSDDPQLYDALAQLTKGRRRVTRLRMLAHDGLVAGSAALVADPDAATLALRPNGACPEGARDRDARPCEPNDDGGSHGSGDSGERSELAVLGVSLTAGIFEPPDAL